MRRPTSLTTSLSTSASKRPRADQIDFGPLLFDYVLVVILTLLAGAWSLPAGLSFGLDPLGVYLAAVVGSVTYSLLILWIGGRWRDALLERFMPDADDKIKDGRAGDILERWGLPGLALVGGLVLGPTITLAAALVLGVDRKRFGLWYTLSVIGGFAALTAFWAAVL